MAAAVLRRAPIKANDVGRRGPAIVIYHACHFVIHSTKTNQRRRVTSRIERRRLESSPHHADDTSIARDHCRTIRKESLELVDAYLNWQIYFATTIFILFYSNNRRCFTNRLCYDRPDIAVGFVSKWNDIARDAADDFLFDGRVAENSRRR